MKITRRDKRTELEKEIDKQVKTLRCNPAGSEEYNAALKALEKLYSFREDKSKKRISADTIAIVAGNLLGIILILTYEKTNVIATKALGFVLRGRV